MINNYYTLRFIALDLQHRFAGAGLSQIFTQHRNELVLTLTTKRSEGHLIVSCEPGKNYLFCREEFPRAKKNSVNLFEELANARVREIQMHPADRQVIVRTDGKLRLIVQLFGSKANLLSVDDADVVRGAFLQSKALIGKPFIDAVRSPAVQTLADLQARLISAGEDLTLGLKRCFPQFGAELIAELLYRAEVEKEKKTTSLTDTEHRRLYELSQELQKTLVEDAKPRIYFEGTAAHTFSIIELRHLKGLRSEEFGSIHTAVRTFLGSAKKQKGFEEELKRLAGYLHQALTKAERTLQKIAEDDELLARASTYELMGKVLTAHLHEVQKGMKKADLQNVLSSEGEMITIPLETTLSPAKNADRYFQKAKKIRQNIEGYSVRKAELLRQITATRELLERLDSIDDADIYKEYLHVHGEKLGELGFKVDVSSKAKQAEQILFRVFTVAGGFQVWAGKSSENNDLLTMKHAKPNDLWFHARGSSGSHVVLKIGTGKGGPSKLAIQQAAGIAAYYSKMKGSKLVPVAMTERKYVRKPKGVPAGTVTLEREKTVFAEPALPDS